MSDTPLLPHGPTPPSPLPKGYMLPAAHGPGMHRVEEPGATITVSVLEAILVGSARHDDDLTAAEEFEIYRGVVRELYRRLDDLQSCYE